MASTTQSTQSRRVVTYIDEEGRSAILVDSVIPTDTMVATAWHTPTVPADNSGSVDVTPPFSMKLMHGGGTMFVLIRMAPGTRADMHVSDTIDYITIISGTMVLEVESGEEVPLTPGTLCIDRGVPHAWRNDGPDEVVYTVVTVPAVPVGKRAKAL